MTTEPTTTQARPPGSGGELRHGILASRGTLPVTGGRDGRTPCRSLQAPLDAGAAVAGLTPTRVSSRPGRITQASALHRLPPDD